MNDTYHIHVQQIREDKDIQAYIRLGVFTLFFFSLSFFNLIIFAHDDVNNIKLREEKKRDDKKKMKSHDEKM